MLLLFLLYLSSHFFGWFLWTNYLIFDTFTGKIQPKLIATKVEFKSKDKKETLESIYDEYLFLYMWITSCGECYKSFPKLQSFYEKFSENRFMNVYAIHCWVRNENEETGINKLQELGFAFPCLSISFKDPFIVESEVPFYPTVLIVNKERELVFRGDLDAAIAYIGSFSTSTLYGEN